MPGSRSSGLWSSLISRPLFVRLREYVERLEQRLDRDGEARVKLEAEFERAVVRDLPETIERLEKEAACQKEEMTDFVETRIKDAIEFVQKYLAELEGKVDCSTEKQRSNFDFLQTELNEKADWLEKVEKQMVLRRLLLSAGKNPLGSLVVRSHCSIAGAFSAPLVVLSARRIVGPRR